MKKFTITIWAYDHHAKFDVESKDDPISLEKAIVDKLGVNDIKWEYLGSSYDERKLVMMTSECFRTIPRNDGSKN